ncbi:hypothetical protein QN355_06375 [Cryobacterium sp. 10S3]|uniref:hypothetical protein n=1 Tax=Cryobacterium sp. 10S3 TaxID=3048582 RepID=UPI002AC8B5F9|nr:hypothetical protein [Cryobacterium sp. 10S3]MEB0286174.1 hypothetical protein [Cryobacterium sp. 10S3]WPX12232.1 hypothetical protein RHM57_11115 [Cryobacterium sp. 10S3]
MTNADTIPTEMTATDTPNTTYLDKLDPERNCPGFYIWDALATDGKTYRMAADYDGGLSVRLFFGTNGALDLVSAVNLGDNPDAIEWKRLRGWN